VPFLDFAPVVAISALTGQRVGRVLEAAIDIWGERRKRVPTGELNRMLSDATARQVPPVVKGRRPKVFYGTQAAVAPPTFVFFANEAGSIHFSYRRYLENRIREAFGFDGTPIKLVFRDRASVRIRTRKRGGRAGGRSPARRVAGPAKGAARASKGRKSA
jgi:GTP-binding protein